MQLTRIYSNQPELFELIDFNYGQRAHLLNVILGEVRRPGDKKRDSHNLGKTTLISLIDFLMLKGMSTDHFLSKNQERLSEFVFFLEIALNGGDYATIRRSVASPGNVALIRHAEASQNFAEAPEEIWDHWDLTLTEAVKLLDAWLDLRVLKPYDYRTAITYFLRSQGDWSDELQLQKFRLGRDLHWKPFVAHLFGFKANAVQRKYELDEQINKLKERHAEQQAEVQFSEDELPALIARIAVVKQHVDELESQLDAFRFDEEERLIMRDLVNNVEASVSEINSRLYDIRYDIRQIDVALAHKDKFDLREVDTIYQEANLYFPEQLKKQYADLIEFNKNVTQERNKALKARKKELEAQGIVLFSQKEELETKRQEQLKIIRSTDTFDKFKYLQKDLTRQRAELVYMEEQRKKLEQVAEIAHLVREAERDRGRIVDEIKTMVSKPTAIYEKFSRIFNEYCQKVLNHEGIFYFYVNSSNNLDYKIGLGLAGQKGKTSNQSDGTSYKKIVCALFDLSLLKVYESAPFFHFVYHDGVLEALDDRRKEALLTIIREQISNNRTQYIMTLIEADLPRDDNGIPIKFAPHEVVLRLHDEGTNGRLFKMAEF